MNIKDQLFPAVQMGQRVRRKKVFANFVQQINIKTRQHKQEFGQLKNHFLWQIISFVHKIKSFLQKTKQTTTTKTIKTRGPSNTKHNKIRGGNHMIAQRTLNREIVQNNSI